MAIDKTTIATRLREYRRTYGQGSEAQRECAKIAFRLASSLGHLPLRQGESVECSRCGKSGYAREALPYTPDPRLTFVSWSEDRDVAAWFAERRSIISQPLAETNPRLRGFIAERTAPTSILFHHSWAVAFDGIAKFAQIHPLVGADGARQISWSLRTQREVITEPLALDPRPTTDLSLVELWLLDRRLTPPWLHDEFLPMPPSASQGCVPEAT